MMDPNRSKLPKRSCFHTLSDRNPASPWICRYVLFCQNSHGLVYRVYLRSCRISIINTTFGVQVEFKQTWRMRELELAVGLGAGGAWRPLSAPGQKLRYVLFCQNSHGLVYRVYLRSCRIPIINTTFGVQVEFKQTWRMRELELAVGLGAGGAWRPLSAPGQKLPSKKVEL